MLWSKTEHTVGNVIDKAAMETEISLFHDLVEPESTLENYVRIGTGSPCPALLTLVCRANASKCRLEKPYSGGHLSLPSTGFEQSQPNILAVSLFRAFDQHLRAVLMENKFWLQSQIQLHILLAIRETAYAQRTGVDHAPRPIGT